MLSVAAVQAPKTTGPPHVFAIMSRASSTVMFFVKAGRDGKPFHAGATKPPVPGDSLTPSKVSAAFTSFVLITAAIAKDGSYCACRSNLRREILVRKMSAG